MLNKMDTYLLQNLQRLEKTGYMDKNPRGRYKSDNEPSHSISIRGSVFETFDISAGEFPITLTRPLPIKAFIGEIQTIYQDQSNKISDFEKNGCGWWSDWVIEDGLTIGLRYGETVREYDQLNSLREGLKNNPFGKRHIIDLYQFEHLRKSSGLHPCAFLTMWTVSEVRGEPYLDLTLVQRSSDYLVAGTGINQMQYVALLLMLAKDCGYKVGLFEHLRKNVHIYDRHFSQLEETLKRLEQLKKDKNTYNPQLILNVPDGTDFYTISIDDFQLIDYNPIKEPLEKFDLAI